MYHVCAFKNLQNHLNQSIQIAKQNNEITQRFIHRNTSSTPFFINNQNFQQSP